MRKPSIWKKKKFKELLVIFLILFLSFWLIRPFLKSGFFPTHDGEWAVVRLGAMHRAIIAGHFPVRWAGNLNFSYGYPLFLFTYPLPYYLGEIFNLFGFGLVNSIKILFVLSVIFSGLAMFLLGRELFGDIGGSIAAIFYLYAPFRLVDLYVRGSLGESLAFVLYPLLFLSLIKFKQNPRRWLALGAIFYGALILTHNVSALLITPFLVIFAFLSSPRRSLGIFVLGVGLASFFLFPALSEKSKIALSQIPLADKSQHFVNFRQLLIPSWGYGSPGSEDAFSFQLGLVHLIGLFLGLILWFKNNNRFFLFFTLCFLVTIFLTLPVSGVFWELPFFKEVDFPWRYLGPASFFLALSLGYLGTRWRTRMVAVVLAFLAIVVNFRYAKPVSFINYPDEYYLTNEATTTSANELMPIWVQEKPTERAKEKVEILSGEGVIKNLVFNAKKVSFAVEAETELGVQINTIYFPGWRVKVDGKEASLEYENERGVIEVPIGEGEHQVLVEFSETPFRAFSDIISLTSLVLVSGLLVKRKIKR